MFWGSSWGGNLGVVQMSEIPALNCRHVRKKFYLEPWGWRISVRVEGRLILPTIIHHTPTSTAFAWCPSRLHDRCIAGQPAFTTTTLHRAMQMGRVEQPSPCTRTQRVNHRRMSFWRVGTAGADGVIIRFGGRDGWVCEKCGNLRSASFLPVTSLSYLREIDGWWC